MNKQLTLIVALIIALSSIGLSVQMGKTSELSQKPNTLDLNESNLLHNEDERNPIFNLIKQIISIIKDKMMVFFGFDINNIEEPIDDTNVVPLGPTSDPPMFPIEITKTDNLLESNYVQMYDYITYTITIKNPSENGLQQQVNIIDNLPNNVTFINSESPGWFYNQTDHYAYRIFEYLQPNETKIMNLTVQVTDGDTPFMINNTVKVNSSILPYNYTYERTRVGYESFSPLQITKNDRTQPYPHLIFPPKTDEVTYINYSIEILNQHDVDVHNVTIRDKLDEKVDFVKASNNGNMEIINGYSYVFWGFDSLNAHEKIILWLNVSIDDTIEPNTNIINKAYVICNETIDLQEGKDTEITLVGEKTKPKTEINVGDPHKVYDGKTFVTMRTPITLIAQDVEDPEHPSWDTGIRNLTYRIDGLAPVTIEEGDQADESPENDGIIKTTIYFDYTCIQEITYRCIDNSYNVEDDNNDIFYMDDTPPTLDLHVDEPKINNFFVHGSISYDGISDETPVTISAENNEDDDCEEGIGVKYIGIEVYHTNVFGNWEYQYTQMIYDNDDLDENNNPGQIRITKYFSEECWYQLHYWSVDDLGNQNPDENSVKTYHFYVDSQGPQHDYWYQGTQYHDAYTWITNQTNIYVHTYDESCIPDGSGVSFINWWFLKEVGTDEWHKTESDIIEDNDVEYDLDSTTGKIKILLNVEEDGKYNICHQSEDKLENKDPIQKHYVHVDSQPPNTHIQPKQPSCNYSNKQDEIVYCVKSNTEIEIISYDKPDSCAVGLDNFIYEIKDELGNTIVSETIYDYNNDIFTLEEGKYKIYYKGIDLLGNEEELQIQNITVDDTAPMIFDREFIGMHKTGDSTQPEQPDYWVKSNTKILINGSNGTGCPDWTMKYKIDDNSWIDITHPSSRPEEIIFPHECKHILSIETSDCLNNTETISERYYVDDTPPEWNIITPCCSGVYANGQTFHVTIHAKDNPVLSYPCYDDHAVGISDGSNGAACIIDIFPTEPHYKEYELNIDDLTYNKDSYEYDGEVTIPSTPLIPDGSCYFVAGTQDDLENGKNTIPNMIYQTIHDYGYGSDELQDLLDLLIDEQKIVEIVIDNDATGVPPDIDILNPNTHSDLPPESFYIHAEITDADTDLIHGELCTITLDGITLYESGTSTPGLYYDSTIPGCQGFVDIPSSINSGENLPLTISISDYQGNIGYETIYVHYEKDVESPVVQIISPVQNSIHSDDKLLIQVHAYDDETDIEDLTLQLNIDVYGYNEFSFTADYSSTTGLYEYEFDISKLKNNSQLHIEAYATDEEGKTGVSVPVSSSVQTSVYFAQWMLPGWNIIEFGYIKGSNEVNDVFESIWNDFDIIFELTTGNYYIKGQTFNTLTEIEQDTGYWVKMEDQGPFYLNN